jgi:hypothetical protein
LNQPYIEQGQGVFVICKKSIVNGLAEHGKITAKFLNKKFQM